VVRKDEAPKTRMFAAGHRLVALVALTALMLGATGCGEAADTTTTEAAVQTTVTTGATVTTENVLVGSYSGEYQTEQRGVAGAYPLAFVVQANGSIEGTGKNPDGSPFQMVGTLGDGDTFIAEGQVEGTDTEVTFGATFKVSNGVVAVEGTWQNAKGDSGTWTASKDD
jgi:hypothetical protein